MYIQRASSECNRTISPRRLLFQLRFRQIKQVFYPISNVGSNRDGTRLSLVAVHEETRVKSIHTTNQAEAAVIAPQQIEIDIIGGQRVADITGVRRNHALATKRQIYL